MTSSGFDSAAHNGTTNPSSVRAKRSSPGCSSAITSAHAQRAFLWDASLLFQEALRGVLGSWEGATLDSSRGRASLVDGNGHRRYSSKVDPDYVLRSSQGTLVLGAKWKNVIVGAASTPTGDEDGAEIAVGRGTRIRISRSDIYQAVSYAQHERYAPCETGLVYPIALGERDALPHPMRVTGFGRPVWILFMDVGYGGQRRFGSFFESLNSCRLPSLTPARTRPSEG